MFNKIKRLRSFALFAVVPFIGVGQASNPGLFNATQRDVAAEAEPSRNLEAAPVQTSNGISNSATTSDDAGAGPREELAAAPVRVYFNDFDGSEFLADGVSGGVIGAGAAESVQGYAGLGPTGNQFAGNFRRNTTTGNPAQTTRLTLSGLPEHRSINLRFLLAVIDSWDGNSGPDYFNISVNGVGVFSKTFNFQTLTDQSYVPPPGGQLTWNTHRGFNASYKDAAYDMTVEPTFAGIPHIASVLVIDFFASGGHWQGGTDESWAVENLEVLISDVGPEPGLPFTDAVSREVSVFMPWPEPEMTDAISREVSVFAYEGPHPLFTDAISREVSVFQPFAPVELTDAISREVSVFSAIPITLGAAYQGTLPVGSQAYSGSPPRPT